MPAQGGSGHNETYGAILSAYRAMARRIAEMLSEEGLTQPQFQALRVVAKKGTVCMREISDEMLVTPANITGIVDRLESRGLLMRTGRKGDRRTTDIELTPKGRALQERVAERYGEFVQNALRVFTPAEQRTLRELLVKLQEAMAQSGG
ncbi:MAG: MarR family transcriptional regulator [Nitrososphaerota archaeon]|nr:MarR family transcriptional regulator [Nitrososphaerota archaeon]